MELGVGAFFGFILGILVGGIMASFVEERKRIR
jgi:Na+/glutamate symporter